MSEQSLTDRLVAEAERDGSTRNSIADLYALGLAECQLQHNHDFVDWPTVNRALLKRYKPSGLNYIKKRAWRT